MSELADALHETADAVHRVMAECDELAQFDSQEAEHYRQRADAWREARARLAEVVDDPERTTERVAYELKLERVAAELDQFRPAYEGALRASKREQAALAGDRNALRELDERLHAADADRAELDNVIGREHRDKPGAPRMRAAIDQERAAIRDQRAWLSIVSRAYAGRRRLPRLRAAGRRIRKRLASRPTGARGPPGDPPRSRTTAARRRSSWR